MSKYRTTTYAVNNMETRDEILKLLEDRISQGGGYFLFKENKRPTLCIADESDVITITIKSLVMVAENPSCISMKAIDTNDEMWDVDDYCNVQQLIRIKYSL